MSIVRPRELVTRDTLSFNWKACLSLEVQQYHFLLYFSQWLITVGWSCTFNLDTQAQIETFSNVLRKEKKSGLL